MRKIIIFIVSIYFTSGCVAISPYEKPNKFLEGSIITNSIKGRLINTNGLDSFQISVSTLNNEVLLSGFVANQDQKDLAQKITMNTKGVTKVINHIEIIP
ncbi:MAG: BON domain-containing protein [Sulfurovum sp.]|nr:BON domain-containing protein [Sulfurovaceae bacterium]